MKKETKTKSWINEWMLSSISIDFAVSSGSLHTMRSVCFLNEYSESKHLILLQAVFDHSIVSQTLWECSDKSLEYLFNWLYLLLIVTIFYCTLTVTLWCQNLIIYRMNNEFGLLAFTKFNQNSGPYSEIVFTKMTNNWCFQRECKETISGFGAFFCCCWLAQFFTQTRDKN